MFTEQELEMYEEQALMGTVLGLAIAVFVPSALYWLPPPPGDCPLVNRLCYQSITAIRMCISHTAIFCDDQSICVSLCDAL